jgi:hypothetical protein
MAIIANSANTYNTVGKREELSDLISNITPTDTPLQKMARKGKVENRYFEWQTDSLAPASFGAGALEGEAAPTAAYTPTVRLGGYTMIRQIAANVTGTEQVIKKAGRGKDELAYQITKRAKELKRHIESEIINNGTFNVGNTTTGRQTRGLYGWLDVNASVAGAGGSALGNTVYSGGAGVTGASLATPTSSASLAASNNFAPVNGTARAFTEALLNGTLQAIYNNGGNPDTIMMTPAHRQTFSTFVGNGVGSGIATRYDEASDSKVTATVSIYESDFGTLKAVANRFIDTATNSRTVYVLESDTIAVNYLRDTQVTDLAKTGDYESKLILSEFGLQVDNVLANGTIRDLT